MALYELPSVPFTAVAKGAPPGLVGTIGVQLTDLTGNVPVIAHTTTGITESGSIPGNYSHLFNGLPPGDYRIVWDTGGVSPVFFEEDLIVTELPIGADLIPFQEYLDLTGKVIADFDDAEQTQIRRNISAASAAIRSVTDRDFTLASNADQSPRQFRYDGSGIIDVDDCSAVAGVSIAATAWNPSRPLAATEWIAGPYGRAILTYLEVWGRFLPGSPAMGFTRNLDNPLYPIGFGPVIIEVDATWGWTTIPADVKQAVVWTIESLRSDPSPFVSESIEGYSRTRRWSTPTAVPDRAETLLDPYTRVNV